MPSEIEEITALRRERDAVILAHNYQPGPVQDAADFVGDSLAMARFARSSPASTLVVAGVHFMAETAAILCPDKRVLLPDPQAGCSLAESITPDALREWKAEWPDAVVVSYVNTSVEIKALSDYCCTSSNAVQVVSSIPPQRDILFLPDMFLGEYVIRETGRKNVHVWMGECHVHAAIRGDELRRKAELHRAEILVHPECGCTTQALAIPPENVQSHVLSTGGMLDHARRSQSESFIVATEVGLLHRLRRELPQKNFIPAQEDAVCPYMQLTSLQKIRDSLEHLQHLVTVPRELGERALLPLERMVAIGSAATP